MFEELIIPTVVVNVYKIEQENCDVISYYKKKSLGVRSGKLHSIDVCNVISF